MENHKVIIEDRQLTTVTDVSDISSFNENTIIIQLNQGGLEVKGNELQIKQLNIAEGKAVIEGNINSITYTKKKTKKEGNVLSRIFK